MNLQLLKTFFERNLWQFRLRDMPPRKRELFRLLRMFTLASVQFAHDRCALRASALTFFTLMSIVPVLAMSFGIAKGFGFEKVLEREIRAVFQATPAAQPSKGDKGKDATEPRNGDSEPRPYGATGAAPRKGGGETQDAAAAPGEGDLAGSAGTEPPSEEELTHFSRALDQAIGFANSMLDNTRGGLIAGIGLTILIWTVISVLGHIEASFNDIWGIKKHRTMLRKLSDYLSFLFIAPILLFLSSSVTVYVTAEITAIVNKLAFLGIVQGFILFGLRVIPFVILWVLFTFTYMFMPNTRVRFVSAFLAALVAGTSYQLFQWVYINSQIGVTKANAIYGSFAALPLFLTWLQVSWMIVLYGAELSYAHQNIDLYDWMEESKKASPRYRRLLMMAITHCCVSRFHRGAPPPSLDKLTRLIDAPPRLLRDCLDRLIEARILCEVLPNETRSETGYQPTRDIEGLTLVDVLDALDLQGYSSLPLAKAKPIEHLTAQLERLDQDLRQSPANVPFREMQCDWDEEKTT